MVVVDGEQAREQLIETQQEQAERAAGQESKLEQQGAEDEASRGAASRGVRGSRRPKTMPHLGLQNKTKPEFCDFYIS